MSSTPRFAPGPIRSRPMHATSFYCALSCCLAELERHSPASGVAVYMQYICMCVKAQQAPGTQPFCTGANIIQYCKCLGVSCRSSASVAQQFNQSAVQLQIHLRMHVELVTRTANFCFAAQGYSVHFGTVSGFLCCSLRTQARELT